MKSFAYLLFTVLSPAAVACSTCMVGDPTLNLMGTEKSYAGRFRVALDYLYRTEDTGLPNFNQNQLTEHRTTLGLAYAWSQTLNLSLRLPWLDKQLEYANLAFQNNRALGDLEMSGKLTLGTDERHAHRHLWGMLLGTRLPTATEQKTQDGRGEDIDIQAGTGAWVPHLGAWYGFYRFPYFFYTSGVLHYAFKGFADFQAGTAMVITVSGQYAFTHRLALQLGLDSRWSATNQFADQDDPDSGGTLIFATPQLIYSPTSDLIIHLGFQYPVLNQLHGEHEEGTTFQLGITYDF